jgi:hypothetical protein
VVFECPLRRLEGGSVVLKNAPLHFKQFSQFSADVLKLDNRIQRRFIKHWPALFRFLEQPELYEPTNNRAERTLRPLVRLRRISQGSRGIAGSEWTARVASIVATCRIQKQSVWLLFQNAVYAKAFTDLPPSLVVVP